MVWKNIIMTVFSRILPLLSKFTTHIGGQAVMGGLLMRNFNVYALAVRNEQGEILVEHHTWYSLSRSSLFRKNFLRGFPLLLESVINGIQALNRSAQLYDGESKKSSVLQTVTSLVLAVLFAIFLFVIIPHVFALFLEFCGISGTVRNISFHIWDGIFKIMLFLGYIFFISLLPEIKSVLQYHGAEHKVISCYESGMTVSAQNAKLRSRLHPRCGTSFVLFVLLIAILIHSIFVPLILLFPFSENSIIMHSVVILFKIVLIIPISAIAYELIRTSGKSQTNKVIKILSFPGLAMQLLTTKEPSIKQLEVAVIALKEVLNNAQQTDFKTEPYTILNQNDKDQTKDFPCLKN